METKLLLHSTCLTYRVGRDYSKAFGPIIVNRATHYDLGLDGQNWEFALKQRTRWLNMAEWTFAAEIVRSNLAIQEPCISHVFLFGNREGMMRFGLPVKPVMDYNAELPYEIEPTIPNLRALQQMDYASPRSTHFFIYPYSLTSEY
jgi:hypothetical protein